MNDLLVILLIAIILFYEEILYMYEIIKLNLQIFYQTIILMVETGYTVFEHEVICKKIDEVIMKEFNKYPTKTESIANYQEGCTIQNLIPEVLDWKQEMIDDLSFYCPMVIIGRIINRFEEIIEEIIDDNKDIYTSRMPKMPSSKKRNNKKYRKIKSKG